MEIGCNHPTCCLLTSNYRTCPDRSLTLIIVALTLKVCYNSIAKFLIQVDNMYKAKGMIENEQLCVISL